MGELNRMSGRFIWEVTKKTDLFNSPSQELSFRINIVCVQAAGEAPGVEQRIYIIEGITRPHA